MKNMQTMNSDNSISRVGKFAEFGINNYAYLRSIEISDLADKFQIEDLDKIEQLHTTPEIWVLFSAEGMPIALGAEPGDLQSQADELELTTIVVH